MMCHELGIRLCINCFVPKDGYICMIDNWVNQMLAVDKAEIKPRLLKVVRELLSDSYQKNWPDHIVYFEKAMTIYNPCYEGIIDKWKILL